MIQPANFSNAPRCQHLKLNGSRCAAPARRHQQFCVFHETAHSRKPEDEVRLVEDAMSLQLALAQTIRELAKPGAVCEKRIALKLYALQIASSNLRRLHQELLDCDMDIARRRWLENYLNQNNVTADLKREILADFDAEFLSGPHIETAEPSSSTSETSETSVHTSETSETSETSDTSETSETSDTSETRTVIPSLQAMASREKPHKRQLHSARRDPSTRACAVAQDDKWLNFRVSPWRSVVNEFSEALHG